ncbi:MAG TPA: hypothetical protein PLC38_07720 [Methanobacterium sp.]|jgi:hypothetical protein|nr:hypothetical protein [Methanobacterium sp.]
MKQLKCLGIALLILGFYFILFQFECFFSDILTSDDASFVNGAVVSADAGWAAY